jgi:16S rRNA (uracil1498-N3)-methyltransferase
MRVIHDALTFDVKRWTKAVDRGRSPVDQLRACIGTIAGRSSSHRPELALIAVMSERFFAEQPVLERRALLTGDEAHHVLRVMRAGVGDELTIFDGSGAEFRARIVRLGKGEVELEIVERRQIDREARRNLTLAVALPKGERQKWLVEKATELGAARLVPLVAERGVAQPTAGALGRLRRTVIEASKQCGRNRLMEIAEPATAVVLFGQPPTIQVEPRGSAPRSEAAGDQRSEVGGQRSEPELAEPSPDSRPLSLVPPPLRLLADPAGGPLAEIDAGEADVLAAIGPEGGFTERERAAALAAGWRPVSLGQRILRVETAAVALAAWNALR